MRMTTGNSDETTGESMRGEHTGRCSAPDSAETIAFSCTPASSKVGFICLHKGTGKLALSRHGIQQDGTMVH